MGGSKWVVASGRQQVDLVDVKVVEEVTWVDLVLSKVGGNLVARCLLLQ
jgi:hypothetical protein